MDRAPPMDTLHDVVLDYITTHAYASTAKILAQPRPGSSSTSPPPDTAGPGPSAYARDLDDGVGSSERAMDVDMGSSSSQPVGKEKISRRGRDRVIDAPSLLSVERRRAILNFILNGAILRAVDALNNHFPSVLTDSPPDSSPTSASNGFPLSAYSSIAPPPHPSYPDPEATIAAALTPNDHSLPVFPYSTTPSHIRLNLQIQQFIESFRQLSPSSPSSPSSSISSLTSSMHMSTSMHNPSSGVTLTNALTAAQGLHSEAKKLPIEVRAVYLQEIKDAGALFAYTDPETSILKGFLDQSRRIALAEQVNKAILHSEGRPTSSQVEMFARRATAVYAVLSEKDVDPRPPWTSADGQGKEWLASVSDTSAS